MEEHLPELEKRYADKLTSEEWCAMQGSNLRPPPCQGGGGLKVVSKATDKILRVVGGGNAGHHVIGGLFRSMPIAA